MAPDLSVREFTPADAEALTAVLHRAYREHDDNGLNFTAATQTAATTLSRAQGGGCWVVEESGTIVATVTVSLPPSHALQELTPIAAEPGTGWLNQFAVDPALQGRGIASHLFRWGLDWAKAQGLTQVGIDTAQPATGLVQLYSHWGFEHRDVIHWDGKTYNSVVMVRPVS